MTRNNNTGHPLLHDGLEIDEFLCRIVGVFDIRVPFHSLVFAVFGQRSLKKYSEQGGSVIVYVFAVFQTCAKSESIGLH